MYGNAIHFGMKNAKILREDLKRIVTEEMYSSKLLKSTLY
jgi:hypothetical protein